MRVLERSVYRGPHLYSVQPTVRIQIDLGELERWPSDRLHCFAEQLIGLLPGLSEHDCSYREPGDFCAGWRKALGSVTSSSMSHSKCIR